ncbi:MAG: sugar transferase [Pseudomonadota bacterium]
MTHVESVPVPELSAQRNLVYRALSRSFDILASSAGLLMLAPLLLGVALAIKLTSKGPVLFRQNRYGMNNELFEILKFRTMYTDIQDVSGRQQTLKDDPRVTSVGRYLRKLSFDELPQLINILRGDMSVVGPRPHVPGMIAAGVDYEDFDRRYLDRHAVRPGLTGLAQIKGYRGATDTPHAAKMRLEYDLEYIRTRTIGMDLKIVFITFWKEFFLGDAY